MAGLATTFACFMITSTFWIFSSKDERAGDGRRSNVRRNTVYLPGTQNAVLRNRQAFRLPRLDFTSRISELWTGLFRAYDFRASVWDRAQRKAPL